MLQITKNKGFKITFENGWTVSVQFGYNNYCNSSAGLDDGDTFIEAGSLNAECAAISPEGRLYLVDGMDDTVIGYQDANEVLAFMNKVAAIPKRG
jgi:hypothetical protein